jgi:hypothetical protein
MAKRITANHHAHLRRRSKPIAAQNVPTLSNKSGTPDIRPIARNEAAAGLFICHKRSMTEFGNSNDPPTNMAMPEAKNKKAATTTTAGGLAVDLSDALISVQEYHNAPVDLIPDAAKSGSPHFIGAMMYCLNADDF